MIYLHSITFNQCRIQGIFGAGIPVWDAQKMSPKNRAVLHPEVSFLSER